MSDENPLDLDAIEARAAAATPGPWKPCGPCARPDGGRCNLVWAAVNENAPIAGGDEVCATNADAQFIGHARTDVPALVAENRRMRALLLEVEWEGQQRIDYDDDAPACPLCGGIDPDSYQAQKGATDGKRVGHAPTCELDAFARLVPPSTTGGADG